MPILHNRMTAPQKKIDFNIVSKDKKFKDDDYSP